VYALYIKTACYTKPEFSSLFIDKHQRLQSIKQLFIFFRKKWGHFSHVFMNLIGDFISSSLDLGVLRSSYASMFMFSNYVPIK
jgi:hypothetical protein